MTGPTPQADSRSARAGPALCRRMPSTYRRVMGDPSPPETRTCLSKSRGCGVPLAGLASRRTTSAWRGSRHDQRTSPSRPPKDTDFSGIDDSDGDGEGEMPSPAANERLATKETKTTNRNRNKNGHPTPCRVDLALRRARILLSTQMLSAGRGDRDEMR